MGAFGTVGGEFAERSGRFVPGRARCRVMSGNTPSQLISPTVGGGAVRGLGESFAPDLQSGTGNLSLPIELPGGRNGLAPQLTLRYSSGAGNGRSGCDWSLSVPGVARQTDKGVPRRGACDFFVLAGAEDRVPVPGAGGGRQPYRPRTEGLFARIERELRRRDRRTLWPVGLAWGGRGVGPDWHARGCRVLEHGPSAW